MNRSAFQWPRPERAGASAGQKVVFITGCSSGIGRALALELSRRGHLVVATARQLAALADLRELARLETLALDVNDVPGIAQAVNATVAKHGRIDMLINNAGVNAIGPLAEAPLGHVRQLLDTNVLGLVAVTQAVVPHMAAARAGRIVNIGSMVAVLPTPYAGAYCASKAAVHLLSEVLRLELYPLGIEVVEVQPGMVRSAIADKALFSPELYDRPQSLYQPLIASIRRRQGASQRRPTATEVFARRVAAAITKRRPPRILRAGRGAKLFLALERVTPGRLQDWVLRRVFGLDARLC